MIKNFNKIFLKILLINLIIFNYVEVNSIALNSEISENEAIAYFILNCAYFTEWLPENDPYQSGKLQISVIANEDLVKSIQEVATQAKKTWFKNGEIIVEKKQPIDYKNYSHIIYIADNYTDYARDVVEHYQSKNTLIIGSINNFIQLGGAIELNVRKNKLSFNLNIQSLEENQIKLKSGLKKRANKIIKSN